MVLNEVRQPVFTWRLGGQHSDQSCTDDQRPETVRSSGHKEVTEQHQDAAKLASQVGRSWCSRHLHPLANDGTREKQSC